MREKLQILFLWGAGNANILREKQSYVKIGEKKKNKRRKHFFGVGFLVVFIYQKDFFFQNTPLLPILLQPRIFC